MKDRDPIGEAVYAVAKRRKWTHTPAEKTFTETKPRLYNPPRSSNDDRKRTGPNRRLAAEAGRRGIIEIRIYDDKDTEGNGTGGYQGCVRLYGGGPSDYIVYVRRAFARGAPSRGIRGGTGSKVVDRRWYIASVQGADFDGNHTVETFGPGGGGGGPKSRPGSGGADPVSGS